MFIKILYILLAIIILLVLITVHELGHYTAGKILKFKINEFSIGFGPAIFKRTKKDGEVFSIRILPLGGYCAFEGEDEDNPSPDAFNNQKPWKRIIVLLAGVTFNFLFGVFTSVIFLSVASFGIPKISAVAPNNQNAFKTGDIVQKVNGKDLEIYRTFSDLTSKFDAEKEFVVTVLRDGELVDVCVKRTNQEGYRYIGNISALEGKIYDSSHNKLSNEEINNYITNIDNNLTDLFKLNDDGTYSAYTEDEIIELGFITVASSGVSLGIVYGQVAKSYTFWQALYKAWPFSIYVMSLIFFALIGLFTGKTALKEAGGTITAISQIAEISQVNIQNFLLLLPMLSMNLALFNILPIPALDGAKTVFVLIEMIFRKPVNRKVEGYIHMVGLLVLFALVIFLDLNHLFFKI